MKRRGFIASLVALMSTMGLKFGRTEQPTLTQEQLEKLSQKESCVVMVHTIKNKYGLTRPGIEFLNVNKQEHYCISYNGGYDFGSTFEASRAIIIYSSGFKTVIDNKTFWTEVRFKFKSVSKYLLDSEVEEATVYYFDKPFEYNSLADVSQDVLEREAALIRILRPHPIPAGEIKWTF